MTNAAIAGFFADFKIVRTRGVCQIVIELPLEQADAALTALGGVPQPASERPVAIARIVLPEERKPDARERYATSDEATQAVTRAGILANDAAFHRWCRADGQPAAVRFIREQCGVKSRADIAANPEALTRFLDMEGRYRSEMRFGPEAMR